MKTRTLVWFVIGPAVVLAAGLVALGAPLPQPWPAPVSAERVRLAVGVTVLLALLYLLALAAMAVERLRRRGRILDAGLKGLGMAAQGHRLVGRRYQGLIHGRDVRARYRPGVGRRPGLLEVWVTADLGTRLAAGRERALRDCQECPRLDLSAWGLDALEVYALDEAYARRLLGDSQAGALLVNLLADQERLGWREFYVQPQRAWLRAHPLQGDATQLQRWFDQTLELTGALERAASGWIPRASP